MTFRDIVPIIVLIALLAFVPVCSQVEHGP